MKSKYLIGEVSKYLDVSKDTLRFYDKKGIVSPVKDSNNGYRYYTNDEIIKLIYLISLKSLEVNLDEIKLLLNNCTLEELKKIIQEKQLMIDKRIEELSIMKETLSSFNKDIDLSLRLTKKIEVIKCPILVFKIVEEEFTDTLVKEIKKLENFTTINSVYYTSIINSNYYENKKLENNIFDGVSGESILDTVVDENYYGYKIYNNKKCIHTVIKISYEIYEEDLINVKRYINDNKLCVIGYTLCRYIAFENNEGNSIDYVELWIPIK